MNSQETPVRFQRCYAPFATASWAANHHFDCWLKTVSNLSWCHTSAIVVTPWHIRRCNWLLWLDRTCSAFNEGLFSGLLTCLHCPLPLGEITAFKRRCNGHLRPLDARLMNSFENCLLHTWPWWLWWRSGMHRLRKPRFKLTENPSGTLVKTVPFAWEQGGVNQAISSLHRYSNSSDQSSASILKRHLQGTKKNHTSKKIMARGTIAMFQSVNHLQSVMYRTV